MLALEIDSTPASLRIGPQTVLYVALRTVWDLLLMDTHSAMTVSATDIVRCSSNRLRNWNLLPSPFGTVIHSVLSSLLTTKHQIVWHIWLRLCLQLSNCDPHSPLYTGESRFFKKRHPNYSGVQR